MRVSLVPITAVLAAVILSTAAYEFGPLCCSNPTNRVRGSDRHGSGAYGASRGSREHGGVDIECQDGSDVYAPLNMTITRASRPYTSGKADINDGIAFVAEGMCFKLWYIRPVRTSGAVTKGQRLGTMLPMQNVYPGITSHVHLEAYDSATCKTRTRTDPAPVLRTQSLAANRNFCRGLV